MKKKSEIAVDLDKSKESSDTRPSVKRAGLPRCSRRALTQHWGEPGQDRIWKDCHVNNVCLHYHIPNICALSRSLLLSFPLNYNDSHYNLSPPFHYAFLLTWMFNFSISSCCCSQGLEAISFTPKVFRCSTECSASKALIVSVILCALLWRYQHQSCGIRRRRMKKE